MKTTEIREQLEALNNKTNKDWQLVNIGGKKFGIYNNHSNASEPLRIYRGTLEEIKVYIECMKNSRTEQEELEEHRETAKTLYYKIADLYDRIEEGEAEKQEILEELANMQALL